jgi:hypothetical protein
MLYMCAITTTLSRVPLLCRAFHYSVARSTTLSRVPLLCRASHCFVVRSTTLSWYSLLCRVFHLSDSLHVNLVCANKLLKSQTRLALCHNVCRVGFSIDLLNIGNQASLVGLSEAHNINHESLFLPSSKAYKAVVKRLGICNLNQRQVNL